MIGGFFPCLRYPFRGKNDQHGIQDIKTVRQTRTVFRGMPGVFRAHHGMVCA